MKSIARKIKSVEIFFMHFLDRFLRTDTRYLAQSGFWLALGKIVNMLVALLLSILYAKYLSKEIYGNYRYVLSIFGILGGFTLSGMVTTMRRSVARGHDKVFLKTTLLIFYSFFAVSIIGIFGSAYFFWIGKYAFGWAFLVGSILVPFSEGLGTWRAYYESKREFRNRTAQNIFSYIFYGIFMVAAVISIYFFKLPLTLGIAILVTASFFSQGLPNVFYFIKILRSIPKNTPSEPAEIRYGVHLSILNIPATVANYIDSVILFHFLGPGSLALYSFAIAPVEQLKAFLGINLMPAFSKLALKTKENNNSSALKKTLPAQAMKASLLSAVVVLVYILAAPYLFQILFPRYTGSIVLTQFFALSLIFFPFSIFNAVLKVEGNMRKIYYYQIADPVIQIGLLFLLIPFWGLWGAIAGRIIGRYASYFIPYIIFRL